MAARRAWLLEYCPYCPYCPYVLRALSRSISLSFPALTGLEPSEQIPRGNKGNKGNKGRATTPSTPETAKSSPPAGRFREFREALRPRAARPKVGAAAQPIRTCTSTSTPARCYTEHTEHTEPKVSTPDSLPTATMQGPASEPPPDSLFWPARAATPLSIVYLRMADGGGAGAGRLE